MTVSVDNEYQDMLFNTVKHFSLLAEPGDSETSLLSLQCYSITQNK